jgi:hypothetical protein
MAAMTRPDEGKTPDKIAPPSSPMLGTLPIAEEPLLSSPILDPDDIDDPVVPAQVLEAVQAPPPPVSPSRAEPPRTDQAAFQAHEALLQGFCQHLQQRLEANVLEHHKHVMASLQSICDTVRKWGETALQANEHSQYQLSDALLKVGEQGLALRHDPYTVRVEAVSQEGFPVMIQVAKPDVAQLTTALPALLAWLQAEGFSPVPRGMAEAVV